MVNGDNRDQGGWFDWAYKGVDHTFPGNGGLECRDFLSITQRLVESVVACIVALCAIIYAWPRLKLPKSCPCIYRRKNDQLGKKILLLLMCLTFGIELGFKFATRQMIWIGNPCHIVTMLQIFILTASPGKLLTAIFRLHLHMLTGAPIAIAFPVINTRLLPFETGVYFVQHILMLVIPFYLLHAGDPFIPEHLSDFSWASTSLALLFIYHFVPLQMMAYVSHVNLNNMLCPAVSDPFHGQYYRLFAISHQTILILILGKICVILARVVNIMPCSNNSPDMANMCLCVHSCFCRSSSCGLSSTDGDSNVTDVPVKEITLEHRRYLGTSSITNDQDVSSRHSIQSQCCYCCGDSISSCCNIKSHRNFAGDSISNYCVSETQFSTQPTCNGHLVTEFNSNGESRRRKQDVSNHKHIFRINRS